MSIALFLALALTDPEAVVSTAPPGRTHPPAVVEPAALIQDAPPHNLTTAQQIDRWLAPSRPAPGEAPLWDESVRPGVHGEVSVTVGTGGYRAVHGVVTAPIGEDGFVTLSYGDSRGGYAIPWR